jgi:hypothetical protein
MRAISIGLTLAALSAFGADEAKTSQTTYALRGKVVDAQTQGLIACRIYIQGGDGTWYFAKSEWSSGSAIEYRKQKDWKPASVEMHTTLSADPFVARLPSGAYTLLAERGKEYLPESRRVIVDQGAVDLTIQLRRWINMAEGGWFSGDTHVHRAMKELPNLLLAEDLNVAFPLTSWVTDAFVSPTKGRPNTDQTEPGALVEVDKTHVIYPRNTEYEIFRVGARDHTLGAFFVLGHKTLFQEGVPPVRPVGRRARAEGALIELDKHNWPWSMMLVPILGADLYELANNHLWRTEFGYRDYGIAAADYMGVERDDKGWTERGWVEYGFQNYYALLNCGFRLRPTAGTASGVHPVPLGFGRVYVHLEQGFSYDGWMRGLNEGRSFVTTGPMLLVHVNGKDPGAVFKLADAKPRNFRVAGVAKSAVPLRPLEIIVNGEVARTIPSRNRPMADKGYETVVDEEITLGQSAWLAVRCFEDRPDRRTRFAHTAPFYIDISERPVSPRRPQIEFLIKRIEDELARHAEVLPAAALEEYREALRIYQEIARTAH